MDEKAKKEKKAGEKIKLATLIYGIGFFGLAILLVAIVFIYRFNNPNNIPNPIYNRVFLPAVIINGSNFISIGDINENLVSIKRFYESQDFSSLGLRFDFKTEDGQKRLKIREKELINKMIEDRAIEILAKEKGINISKKTAADNVDRKMDEYGNKSQITENLDKLYGWSINDFKNKIVKPSLYKDALEKWLAENDGKEKNEKSQKSAQATVERLKNEDFEKVAKEISEGGTADIGGKLGWFQEDQISSEIKKDVIALGKGKVSGVLESKLGYHIIKLDNTRETDGQKAYEISQIFFPKVSFAAWLDKKMKEMKITVLLMNYQWNKEESVVMFKDKNMEKFEADSLNRAEKDASLMAL